MADFGDGPGDLRGAISGTLDIAGISWVTAPGSSIATDVAVVIPEILPLLELDRLGGLHAGNLEPISSVAVAV